MSERPKIPATQIIYGDTVYWLCVVSCLVCMIGPIFALINVDNNVINPHFLFGGIFSGKTAEEVWSLASGGHFPGGHFWTDNFTKGDGFTQFGLALGGFVAMPALILSGLLFLKGKKILWTLLSFWVAFMITVSALNLVNAGH